MEISQLPGSLPPIPRRLYFRQDPFNPLAANRLLKSFSSRATAFSVSEPGKPDSESQNRMFILGMGFVGQFFARKIKSEGWVVSGTCTSVKKKKEWISSSPFGC